MLLLTNNGKEINILIQKEVREGGVEEERN
jgi:hypothetical protein